VLDVLFGRLSAFPAAQTPLIIKILQKKLDFFFNYKYLVIKTLDMELDPLPTSLDSDPDSVNSALY
jgi:hypothetical protein